MPDSLTETVRLLKAAAEPSRLRLLALCHCGESSVSELVRVLGQSQPRISRHLKVLCEAGLLERFRDGHWVYYRTPATGSRAVTVRQLLSLVPDEALELRRDAELAAAERRQAVAPAEPSREAGERELNRAVLDTVLTAPVGRLLDVGAGSARMLKLLGRRATRAIGVDIDGDKRLRARAELAVAGLGNCSIRAGDAHRLDFGDAEFDTVIIDELLAASPRPRQAITEAARVLAPGGRLLIIERLGERTARSAAAAVGEIAAQAGLGLGQPRMVPARRPEWLLAVAQAADESATGKVA